MKTLAVTIVCFCFVLSGLDTAAAQSRQELEAKLKLPAELKLPIEGTVSIGEVLSQIQQSHGVRVRLDRAMSMLMMACLSAEMDSTEGTVAVNSCPGPNCQPNVTPVVVSPYSVQSSYTTYQSNPYVVTSATPATTPPPEPLNPQPAPVVPASGPPAPVAPTPSTPIQATPSPVEPVEATLQPVVPANLPETENSVANESSEEPSLQFQLGLYEKTFRLAELNVNHFDASMTVEQVLRTMIGLIAGVFDLEEEFSMLPASYSHAYDWDLMLSEHEVIITTRLQSNLSKYVRVYRIPADCDVSAEELAELLRGTVRPWSWRDHIDQIIDMVQADIPEDLAMPDLSGLNIDLTGDETEVTLDDDNNDETVQDETMRQSGKMLRVFGSLLRNGTRAFAHGLISTLQQAHHADPPTATINTLPGMLVITQSRGAHQEIENLLQQLETVGD